MSIIAAGVPIPNSVRNLTSSLLLLPDGKKEDQKEVIISLLPHITLLFHPHGGLI
jgi:hypothetical protein